MGKTIVEVTELVNWKGKLTGVLRVLSELSSRFADQPDTIFVEWIEQQGAFYEVDLLKVLRDKEIEALSTSTITSQSRGQQLAALARKVETRLPVSRPLVKVSKKTARAILGTPQSKPLNSNQSVLTPKKGDLFVILSDWHERPYVDKVASFADNGTELVIMVHDMLPFVTPQFSGHATQRFKYFVSQLYPRASLVLANSRSTKNDTTNWLKENKLRCPHIEVIRLGDDFHFANPKQPSEAMFRSERLKKSGYILCVGTIEARKNHTLLYYVYKLAKQRHLSLPPLIVVGRRGWKSENIYDIICDDPETTTQIVFLHNAGDEELAWLYEHCLYSIYPSFYEGWGLPIAESIAHGVPCISSNTSSMPEIAGNLITYFSPDSSDECLSAMLDLLEPKTLAQARKKLKQYKPATWDETFNAVQKAIGEIHAS